MKVFVPFTDDMMDEPGFAEMLIPYQAGLYTLSQIPDLKSADQSRSKSNLSPATTSSSEALPALSSNTYIAGPSLG